MQKMQVTRDDKTTVVFEGNALECDDFVDFEAPYGHRYRIWTDRPYKGGKYASDTGPLGWCVGDVDKRPSALMRDGCDELATILGVA